MLSPKQPKTSDLPGMPDIKSSRGNTSVDIRKTGQSPARAVDIIAEEVPVALVYNGISHAVMMATPEHLEDFALGFSLTEGILTDPSELYDLVIEQVSQGVSINLEISSQRFAALKHRRRNLTGRTGCGLCGTESLAQAIRPVNPVTASPITDTAIQRAIADLEHHQPLQALTGAAHGAAWCNESGEILSIREDVGRHNALDKLVGALVQQGGIPGEGFALISSRASYEMVQKSCSVGIGVLVAVSAPTSLAIEKARDARQLLIGFARKGRHVIYNDPFSSRNTQ